MTNKQEASAMLNASLDNNMNFSTSGLGVNITPSIIGARDNYVSSWDYWQGWYYPYYIRESYPVYIRERAEDKGKQAFEIIKALQDKKVLKLDKVSDFIEVMDILIKIL